MIPDRLYQPLARAATAVATRSHRLLTRLSGGRLGWSLGGLPMIFLRTTGARTGQMRSVPLQAAREGGDWLVTGSNSGQHRLPGWVANLRAHPEATVVLRDREVPVRAEEVADPAERERLYGVLTAQYPGYAAYPRHTDRTIPVFRLHPSAPDQRNG
ncbi:MAG TPA: nitroreductase/quinone reductase family protein [Candidatus Dormibacteraeota bacterium]|nr:nitroreductase/quinone reductase family protein [Candidatus Dormibacteraeota bacterium]